MSNWVCLLNATYFLSCQLLKNWHWACDPTLLYITRIQPHLLHVNMLHHIRAQFTSAFAAQLRVACLIFSHTPTTLEASLVQVVGPASAQTTTRPLPYARQPIFLQAFQLGFHLCIMKPTHAWSAARVPCATSLLISICQPKPRTPTYGTKAPSNLICHPICSHSVKWRKPCGHTLNSIFCLGWNQIAAQIPNSARTEQNHLCCAPKLC